MLRMCASNIHSYTHLILALGIVREPTIWVFITSKYPGTHDIGLPTDSEGGEIIKLHIEGSLTIPIPGLKGYNDGNTKEGSSTGRIGRHGTHLLSEPGLGALLSQSQSKSGMSSTLCPRLQWQREITPIQVHAARTTIRCHCLANLGVRPARTPKYTS